MDPVTPPGTGFRTPSSEEIPVKDDSLKPNDHINTPATEILGSIKKPGLFTKLKNRIRPAPYEERLSKTYAMRDKLDAQHAEMIQERDAARAATATINLFTSTNPVIKPDDFLKIFTITVNNVDLYSKAGKTKDKDLAEILTVLKNIGKETHNGENDLLSRIAKNIGGMENSAINLNIQVSNGVAIININ